MNNTHTMRAAYSVAASVLAMEVKNRKSRYKPDDIEQHKITTALEGIVSELRLGGIAAERVENVPKEEMQPRWLANKGIKKQR